MSNSNRRIGKQLILERYSSSKLLKESQDGVPEGMMRVKGIAAKVGVKNRNGRIYTADNYKHHVELLKKQIPEGLYGELEHPEGFTIDLNRVSHKIEDLEFDDDTGTVYITLLLLDNERGRTAQSIIKSGGTLRVSSRATGTVDSNDVAIIDELITYDIVGTPGFSETALLKEGYRKLKTSNALLESYVVNLNNERNANQNSGMMKKRSLLKESDKNALCKRARTLVFEQKSSAERKVESIIKRYLVEKHSPALQKWLIESFASNIQDFTIDLMEKFIKYQKLCESVEAKGKKAISFSKYIHKIWEAEEKTAKEEEILTKEEQIEECEKTMNESKATFNLLKCMKKMYEQLADTAEAEGDKELAKEATKKLEECEKDMEDAKREYNESKKRIAKLKEENDETETDDKNTEDKIVEALRRKKINEALKRRKRLLESEDDDKFTEDDDVIEEEENIVDPNVGLSEEEFDQLGDDDCVLDEDGEENIVDPNKGLSEEEFDQLGDDDCVLDEDDDENIDDEEKQVIDEDDDENIDDEEKQVIDEDDDENIDDEDETPIINESKRNLSSQRSLIKSINKSIIKAQKARKNSK